MATVFRGPLIFRTWRPDPFGPALRSEWEVKQTALRLQLKQKDKFFGTFGQTKTYDWPLPLAYHDRDIAQPSIVLRTWISNPWAQRYLVGKDKFFGVAGNTTFGWDNPRLNPRPRLLGFIDTGNVYYTVVTVDLPPGNTTFGQNLPVAYYVRSNSGARPRLLGFTDSYNLTLIGQDRLPFSQDEWPVPKGPPQGSINLRSWTGWYNLNLRGQDQMLPQYDWGVPYAATNQNLRGWLNVPFFGVTLPPFSQEDWPVPRGWAPLNRGWTAWYNLNLISQDQLPFSQREWPVPRAPVRVIDLVTWSMGFAINLIPTAAPFSQSDWPLPRGAAPNFLRTWLNWYNLNLVGQDQLPFFETDWPIPRGAPQGAITQRGWIDQTKRLLIGQDLLPFSQEDWPVPKAPARARDLSSWTVGFSIQSYPTAVPFAQSDWPIPRGAVPSIALRSWVDQLHRYLIGKDKLAFRQTEWPVPPAPRRGIVLNTWLDQTRRQLIGKDTLPFRQNEWLVPPAPRQQQYTIWTQGFAIQHQFVQPPFSQINWPNPPLPGRRRNQALSLTGIRVQYLQGNPFYQVYIIF